MVSKSPDWVIWLKALPVTSYRKIFYYRKLAQTGHLSQMATSYSKLFHYRKWALIFDLTYNMLRMLCLIREWCGRRRCVATYHIRKLEKAPKSQKLRKWPHPKNNSFWPLGRYIRSVSMSLILCGQEIVAVYGELMGRALISFLSRSLWYGLEVRIAICLW